MINRYAARGISVCGLVLGLMLSTGCVGMRTFSFNGVPYPDAISATAAVETFYSGIENGVAVSGTQLPASLLIVVPSHLYARTHWIRVRGNRAALGEDQMQYLAHAQVRDALCVARCVQKSGAFKTVKIVEALSGTIEPAPQDLQPPPDFIMKPFPSGQWGIGPGPLGPCVPVPAPTGLQGVAYINALVSAVYDQAAAQEDKP